MTIEKRSVCWSCGDEHSNDALASFGDRMICGSCKPNYVQSVKENVQPQSAAQSGPDWLLECEIGLGDLFSRTFEAYGKVFKSSIMMALIVLGPIYLITLLIKLAAIQTANPAILAANGLFGLIAGILGIPVMLGVIHAVHRHTDGESTDWNVALSFGFSRFRSGFGTLVLAGLIVFGLMLLLFVPGIIWAIYYTFVAVIIGTTDFTGKEALDYSKSLVKGRWWRVFGYIFLLNIMVYLVSGGGAIIGIFVSKFSPYLGAVLSTGTEFLGTIVSYLAMTFSTIFFLNLHYRNQDAEEV